VTQTAFGMPPGDFGAAFTDAAARFFDLLKAFAAQPPPLPGQPPDWTSFAATLGAQFEQWLKASPAAGAAFAAATGFPGGAFPGAGPAWPPGAVPIGPAAASAGEAEGTWALLMKLGQLQAQLTQHWSQIASGAAQRFMERLRTAGRTDLSPDNALALYESWVECAEEAYAASVRTAEFSRLQAELTNTAMALLLAQRRQAEALARAWGLPTREEADALQRQIRQLRQQLSERASPPRSAGTDTRAATPRTKPRKRPSKPPAAAARRARRGGARRGRR
jgi:hypothetical protein